MKNLTKKLLHFELERLAYTVPGQILILDSQREVNKKNYFLAISVLAAIKNSPAEAKGKIDRLVHTLESAQPNKFGQLYYENPKNVSNIIFPVSDPHPLSSRELIFQKQDNLSRVILNILLTDEPNALLLETVTEGLKEFFENNELLPPENILADLRESLMLAEKLDAEVEIPVRHTLFSQEIQSTYHPYIMEYLFNKTAILNISDQATLQESLQQVGDDVRRLLFLSWGIRTEEMKIRVYSDQEFQDLARSFDANKEGLAMDAGDLLQLIVGKDLQKRGPAFLIVGYTELKNLLLNDSGGNTIPRMLTKYIANIMIQNSYFQKHSYAGPDRKQIEMLSEISAVWAEYLTTEPGRYDEIQAQERELIRSEQGRMDSRTRTLTRERFNLPPAFYEMLALIRIGTWKRKRMRDYFDVLPGSGHYGNQVYSLYSPQEGLYFDYVEASKALNVEYLKYVFPEEEE